jgi:hypothetical protein
MEPRRLARLFCLIAIAGSVSLGLAACGSDDESPATGGAGSNVESTGTTSKSGQTDGQVTPEKKAPDSAGDKGNAAPDDVISERPGGPKDSSTP